MCACTYLPTADRYTIPRSPNEDDRSELLRQIEPIDYRDDHDDEPHTYGDGLARGENGGYQSRSSRFGSGRTFSRPPKGIFDDI